MLLEEDGEEREHVEVHVEAEEGGVAAEVDGVHVAPVARVAGIREAAAAMEGEEIPSMFS